MSPDPIDTLLQGLELDDVHLTLIVAHRPDQVEVSFTLARIDGVEIPLRHRPLPSYQGFGVALGSFTKGREYKLEWELETRSEGLPRTLLIGHYPGNALGQRTVLERIEAEKFSKYSGTAMVKV